MEKIPEEVLGNNEQEKKEEEILYQEREKFISEEYPVEKSDHDMEDLLAKGLDGMDVVERRDKSGDIEALLSYEIAEDNEGLAYCSMAIALTREESRGEGIMDELVDELKVLAKERGCEYIVAVADTSKGRDHLEKNGFERDVDPVNKREHFRFDL